MEECSLRSGAQPWSGVLPSRCSCHSWFTTVVTYCWRSSRIDWPTAGGSPWGVAIDAAHVVRLAVHDILRATERFPGCDRDESQQDRVGDADHGDQKPRELVAGAANFYMHQPVNDQQSKSANSRGQSRQDRAPQPGGIVVDPVGGHLLLCEPASGPHRTRKKAMASESIVS